MQDSRDLVAWAKPNTLVLNDQRAEAAVLNSLSNRGSAEADQPYLRPCGKRDPLPLIEAMVGDQHNRAGSCDRCGGARAEHRIWVPCGESVSELACCGHCRRTLDTSCGNVLVWR